MKPSTDCLGTMRQLVQKSFIFLLALMVCGPTMAIDLTQALDKTSVDYEGQVTLTISVQWVGGQTAYLFDRPVQPTLDKLRVQRFATSVSSQPSANGEVTLKTFSYTLVPTGSGIARVEPMTIHYVSWPDSIPGDLATSAMTLSVSAAKPTPKSTGLLSLMPLWGWLSVWGVVLGAGAVGVVIFLRGRKSPVPEKIHPAAALLDGLTVLQVDSGSDLKRFQTGLYKLLTKYVEEQIGSSTAGRSADELASLVNGSKLTEAEKEKVTGWLLRADREKFSPLPPAPGETIRLEAEVRSFFEQMQMKK